MNNELDFKYKALILNVVDGDTVDAQIDVGFKIHTIQRLRLLGINAPEKHGETIEAGLKSKQYLSDLILGKEVMVQTVKDATEKYGRYLANIYIDNIFINQLMLESGNAVAYMV